MDSVDRPLIEQTFSSIAVTGITNGQPVQLANNLSMPSMIQTILLCNPSTSGSNVFFGDANVSTATGIELVSGTSVMLLIEDTRQLYEIQDPSLLEAQMVACAKITPIAIPVIVWNPQNLWFIAPVAGPIAISAMLFRNVYT